MASNGNTNNVLMIVIDVQQYEKLNFHQLVDQVMVFINSYLLSSPHNTIGLLLCHKGGSTLVYPSNVQCTMKTVTGKYEPLSVINETMKREIKSLMAVLSEAPPTSVCSSTVLSCALSKCLCYIQRTIREARTGVTVHPRILVIRGDRDNVTQHVSIMNCIFAAQKQNIPIDCCVLEEDSTYLQQATDITGGIYINIPDPKGLLQYLLWIFLIDVKSRSIVSLPSSSCVDYRAACFCHQKLVEIGFVCSICLAVLCNFMPICPICQTHFKLPMVIKSKKKGKGKNKSKS